MSFYQSFEQYVQSVADGKIVEIALSHRGLDDEACRSLAAALAKSTVAKVVDLQSNHITNEGAAALCAVLEANTSIVEINLEHNDIDDAGADRFIATMSKNSTLVALVLTSNRVSPKKMEELSFTVSLNTQPAQVKALVPRLYANDPQIHTVELSGLAGVSIPLLRNVLANNTEVKALTCTSLSVGDVGAPHFAALFKENHVLEAVDLSANGITLHGTKSLAEGLKANSSIRRLVVRNNKLGDEAARTLVELLQFNDSLVEIDAADNAISASALDAIHHCLDLNRQPLELKRAYYAAQVNDPKLVVIDFPWIPNMTQAARFLSPVLKANTYVTMLNLSNARIGDTGADNIAVVLKANKSLQRLELANNDITSTGGALIAAALAFNSSVVELNLANNRICDIGASEFAHTLLTNSAITFLNLELNDISAKLMDEVTGLVTVNNQPRALKALLPALEASSDTITVIDFSQYDGERYHTDESARVLCSALSTNSFVVSVDLSFNSIGDEGALHFAALLAANRSIETLNLGNCAIGDRGGLELARALYGNETLTELDLNSNCISETTGAALLDMLKENHFLSALNVDRTRIGEAMANDIRVACAVNTQPQALKRVIPRLRGDDATLVELDLSVYDGHRYFNDAAVAILCHEMMSNDRITHLDLSSNQFGADGAAALGELLSQPHCRLAYLSVAGNKIGQDGAKALAAAFERNSSLKTVDLRNTGIGSVGVLSVAKSLDKNDSILTISIAKEKDITSKANAELTRQLAINSQSLTLKAVLPLVLQNDPNMTSVAMIGDGEVSVFGDTSANLLALALTKNKTVTTVDLRNNDITSEGAEYFADMLEDNSTVVEFNLAYNRITDAGAQALIRIMAANNALRRLDLTGNPVSESVMNELDYVMRVNNGPVALKKVMVAIATNSSDVTIADFTGGREAASVTDDSLHILCSLLVSNSQVTSLKLANNEITDEGAQLIADMLRANKTVAEIILDNNRITTEGAHAIFLALKVNHTLCELSLAGNNVSPDVLEQLAATLIINKQPLRQPKNAMHILKGARAPRGDDGLDNNTLFRDPDYMRECEGVIFEEAMKDFHSPPKRVPLVEPRPAQ